MSEGTTVENSEIKQQIHYRLLHKNRRGEIREYPPQLRIVYEFGQEVRVYFPYTLLAWKKGYDPKVAFAEKPVRTRFSEIYYPFPLISHTDSFSICTGDFRWRHSLMDERLRGWCDSRIDDWCDFFWRSDFGRVRCSKHLNVTIDRMKQMPAISFTRFCKQSGFYPKLWYWRGLPKHGR